jgi:transposase InsO family protein
MATRGRRGSRSNVGGRSAAAENQEQAAADNSNVIVPTFTRQEEKDVIQIPTFNGTNFSMWSNTMEVYLQYKGLWCVVVEEPPTPLDDQTSRHQMEAWLVFSSRIAPDIFNNVKLTCEKSPHKVWERLKKNYAAASIHGIYRVWTSFTRVPYENNLLKFITKIETALAEVHMIGLDTKQSVVTVTIMKKITEKRPDMMERLLGDMNTLSDPSMLLDKFRELANHEQVQKLAEASIRLSMALATTSASSSQGSSRQQTSRFKRKKVVEAPCAAGYHNPESDTHVKSRCWFLHLHLNPHLKVQANKEKGKSATNYNTTTAQENQPAEYYAHVMGNNTNKNAIILDSGAIQHMFNSIDFFVSAEPTLVYIVTGSGKESSESAATHKGIARINVGGATITLKKLLFVPHLSTNLVSFAQLVKESAMIKRVDDGLEILLNGNHTLKVKTDKGIFEIDEASANHHVARITQPTPAVSPLQKWHLRLRHASLARIKVAINDPALSGVLTCDACLGGKMTRDPFNGHFVPTEAALKVVHGDLVGPITPATNGGCRYFLKLVDQHTGYIHVSLLKEKSDAVTEIVKFKTKFEKQTNKKIKKLITDGGGEFCNNALGELLEKEGIQHNVSPPYTPQHNGMAERANRTIIEMTRCMMLQSYMVPEWWGEAVVFAAATANALPSLAKSKALPVELMLKLKPRMDFFRPFGCRVWALKPKANRGNKFYAISWEGTLVGYVNNYSAYCIFRDDDKSFTFTREVQFNEQTFPEIAAIHRSLNVCRHAVEDSDIPVFAGDPIFLPFEDSPLVEPGPDPLDVKQEEAVEDFPQNLSGRRWIYVPDVPPESAIWGDVSASNIVEAPRICRPVCYVSTSADPKSHAMAMKCAKHKMWTEAKSKEVDNMMQHEVWIQRPRRPDDSPIASTWAYRCKLGQDNQVVKYKAQICAQGF